MPGLAENIESLNKAFHDFKESNDSRLIEIENNGSADPLLVEKIDKANVDIDKYHDMIKNNHKETAARIDELETIVNRQGQGTPSDSGTSEAVQFFSMVKNMDISANDVSVDEYTEYKNALNKYMRRGEKAIPVEVRNALSAGSDPDGGYWVTPDKTGQMAKLAYETSPMRQIASVQVIGGDSLEGYNDLDESTTGWVSETGARAETDTPGLGKWKIPLHEQYAEPRTTQKILDDAGFNVESWLNDKTAMKMGRTENAAFFGGDGINRPRGFLTYAAGIPSSVKWDVIEQINSGSATTLTADGLLDLTYALKAYYRQGASFLISRQGLSIVRKLKYTTSNEYIWRPDFSGSQGAMLLGYPVVESEDMPNVAANTLSVAIGDFRQGYQVVDTAGIRVLRDPYTKKGYVKFYTTKRVGGDVINFEAIKIQKIAV